MASLDLAGIKAGLLLIPVVCGVVGYLILRVWRGLRKGVRLVDQVLGTEERPGILTRVEELSSTVELLRKEVHPNHGQSLGEAVYEIRLMATEAKDKAADAASEAEGLSGAVARLTNEASRERRGLQESLDVLTSALQEFASEMHVKEVTYLADAREQGVNLRPLLSPPTGE